LFGYWGQSQVSLQFIDFDISTKTLSFKSIFKRLEERFLQNFLRLSYAQNYNVGFIIIWLLELRSWSETSYQSPKNILLRNLYFNFHRKIIAKCFTNTPPWSTDVAYKANNPVKNERLGLIYSVCKLFRFSTVDK
jgi:hypothetical protein